MGSKDITEKILADYGDVFADIINGILFDGRQVVSENALENVKDKSQYKFNNQIYEQERDVSKIWIPHRVRFSLFGLEHQTHTEPFMPIRIIGYDGASYRGQLTKREKDKKKYPVITIVLYFGIKHWDKPQNLYACMDIPKELKPFVNDYKINLVEVAFLDDKLDKFHSDFRIIAEYFINKRKNVDYVPSAQEIKHVDEFLKLLQALTGDNRYYEVLNTLQKEQKKEGIKMCEILDRVESKGIAIGEKLGEARGIKLGEARGEKRGRENMANELNKLTAILLEQNRLDDLKRAISDTNYQNQLMAEYGIGNNPE
ncbi:MAG: Rpn family recombination-promoting nuclease/putative transposase [Lachnospiraceae bacterium]|nr:Rpn family recombination-promoting nuclease/putative transposase [Lachnospiraceae bacterium]